jgi:hypothetical protein
MKRGDKTSEDENVRWSEKFLTLNDFFYFDFYFDVYLERERT